MDDDGLALGLIETHGLVAALEAADAMLKAADVRLLAREQTVPALITVQVVGEVAAVQAAIDAGRAAAERVGRVVSAHIIPRPDPSVRAMQASEARPRPTGPTGDLEEMTVQELRALARDMPDFPLQGREIARARKEELIDLLRAQP